MVWFQCEDCGEDLKKPKLPGHFRACSAYKLSCIDCGQTFTRDTVQSHTQCISEAEKYGPKGQGKPSQNAQAKADKPKPNADIDINVGLSTCPPWSCSLCNTTTTSNQTLLLHADGKKHRARAKAFHASQKQSNVAETSDEKGISSDALPAESVKAGGLTKFDESKDTNVTKAADTDAGEKDTATKRKRTDSASNADNEKRTKRQNLSDLSNGEVIQAENGGSQCKSQTKKDMDVPSGCDGHQDQKDGSTKEIKSKIKWKKIITSTLKSNSGRVMKIKKLQKLVIKAIRESGVTEDKDQLRALLMEKIASSSRFSVDGKHVSLVA